MFGESQSRVRGNFTFERLDGRLSSHSHGKKVIRKPTPRPSVRNDGIIVTRTLETAVYGVGKTFSLRRFFALRNYRERKEGRGGRNGVRGTGKGGREKVREQ